MKTAIKHSLGIVVGLSLLVSLTACNMLPWGKKDDTSTTTTTSTSTGDGLATFGGGKTTSPTGATPAGGMDKKAAQKSLDAGNALAKQGKWTEAIAQFEQAAKADPTSSIAHAQMGWGYAEQKKWEDARKHLAEAIKIDPRNAAAHANLAWVYAEQKQWDEARSAASKAIDIDPKNPYAHATLAWAYQSTDQIELAISEYEKSVQLLPSLANSHFALGMAYCNKGLEAKAKAELAKLQSLGSGQAAELTTRIGKKCYGPKK